MQIAQEMLFVWPESGAMAALEAANKEPVLSPHMTKQVRGPHCMSGTDAVRWHLAMLSPPMTRQV